MTADNFTPISSGAVPDAATFNNPLGQLDDALGAPVATLTTARKTLAGAINELNGEIIGDMSDLITADKSSLVAAINEVNADVGSLGTLTTTANSSSVAAANELDGDIGDLATLTTYAKGSLVAALNEVEAIKTIAAVFSYTVFVAAGQSTTPKYTFGGGHPAATVDWGDGTAHSAVTSGVEMSHEYTAGGGYVVTLEMGNQYIWVTAIDISSEYITKSSWWQKLLRLKALTRVVGPWAVGYGVMGTLSIYSYPSQNHLVLYPTGYIAGAPTPLVMYHGGMGEDCNSILTDSLKTALIQDLLTAGYMVVASNAHGNNWGNDASLRDFIELHDYLSGSVNISRTVLLSQSMGGASGLLTAAMRPFAIKGWAGIYPVCNLYTMWGGGLSASINTAYGLTGGEPDYLAKTSGHDPVLRPASEFDIRMRFYASPGDLTVPKADNSDVMKTLVNAVAIESVVVVCTGVHGDPSHFQSADLISFFNRCV